MVSQKHPFTRAISLLVMALLIALPTLAYAENSDPTPSARLELHAINTDATGANPAQITPCDPATEPHIISRGSTLNGALGNADSAGQAVSADGRYVVFRSEATNLVVNDTNQEADIFVRDRQTCETTRVSVASDGTQANESSAHPSISSDGRYVVFHSKAANLVSNDTNDYEDVYLHDRQTGQTRLISHTTVEPITSGNSQSWQPVISADGLWIAYTTRANNLGVSLPVGNYHVVLYSVAGDTLTLISLPTGSPNQLEAGGPSISGDGQYVAYAATTLDATTDTTGQTDIYLYDRLTATNTRVSTGIYNGQPNGLSTDAQISTDGQYITYASTANNIAGGDLAGCAPYPSCSDIFLYERATGVTRVLTFELDAGWRDNGHWRNPSISADGRFVVFDGGYPATSPTCSYWNVNPFPTNPPYLTPVWTYTPTPTPTHTSTATRTPLPSFTPTFTPTATRTPLPSFTPTFTPTPTRTPPPPFTPTFTPPHTSTPTHTPTSTSGPPPTVCMDCGGPGPQDDSEGSAAAEAPQLLEPICADVFLYDRLTDQVRLVSRTDAFYGNARSLDPMISGNGAVIVFDSRATNLVGSDTNNRRDVVAIRNADAPVANLIAPSALTAVALSPSQIQLDWQDNTETESGYRLERSPDGLNNWVEIGIAPADTTAYTNVSLICGTPYHYRARAYRASDMTYSAYSNVAHATTSACPTSCNSSDVVRLVSRASDGTLGNEWSTIGGFDEVDMSISRDGRYIAFSSRATNLVSGDTNNLYDTFLADTQTCQIWRVSVAGNGTQGNGFSTNAAISGDGRYIGFISNSTNLLPVADPFAYQDWFVHDRITGQTRLVSGLGTDAAPIFQNEDSWFESISLSDDGRYIAFSSRASNLTVGLDPRYPYLHVFLKDMQTGVITLVSEPTTGAGLPYGVHPNISGDGRFVTFQSDEQMVAADSNPGEDIYVFDRTTGELYLASVTSGGGSSSSNGVSEHPGISDDGRYIVFYSSGVLVPSDTNNTTDIYLHDRLINQTIRVSQSQDGQQGNAESVSPTISDDGRYVSFGSWATTLGPSVPAGNPQIYLWDRQTQAVSLVSTAADGSAGNMTQYRSAISGDGRFVIFDSSSTNLVANDTNGVEDVFVVNLQMRLVAAPSALTATTLDDGRIQLNWMDNASDETEYRLERSPDGLSNWVEIGIAPANTTTYTNVSLICGTPYHYRVRAYRASDMTYSAYSNVATATTNTCPPAAPSNLTATTISQTGIQLTWTDNASDETNFGIERSPNGTSGWSQIGSTLTNVANFTDTIYLTCGTTYHYRVRAYRSGDGVFSAYSFFVASATTSACVPDALAIVNPATRSANLLETLNNPPAPTDYTQFATGFPHGTGGRYVTGDWNGDGVDTIGVYWNGAFFFTNDYGTGGTWGGVWFGLGGQPVVGRFDANVNHDCLGVTDSGTWFTGDAYFALYFTCNLTSGPTPPLTFQWLSILLPSSQGFTGTHQFVAGDFDGDGVDSVAVRRGGFIAWTNIPPTTLLTQFNLAQYIGAPGNGDEGKVVTGDWDMSNMDSFGLVYQNGTFYRRNDLDWNSGVYILQQFASQVGTPFDVASWRPK